MSRRTGIALGAGAGLIFGAALGNAGAGMVLGAAAGLLLPSALDRSRGRNGRPER